MHQACSWEGSAVCVWMFDEWCRSDGSTNDTTIEERSDVDDNDERYYRNDNLYVGKPLHKHIAPARQHEEGKHTQRAHTQSTSAQKANMPDSIVATWALRTGRGRAGRTYSTTAHNANMCNSIMATWAHRAQSRRAHA